MIAAIFGKKGSGKTVLSKQYMMRLGGRVIFVSPVETIALQHTALWALDHIPPAMINQRPGQVLLVRLASVDALDVICAQAIADPLGYTIVIDEMDKYFESRELLDAVHYARHFDIHIIGNTRRYTNMPRLMTSQADELCVFASQEPRDIDYLRHFTTKDFAEHCKTLPPFSYLHWPTGKTLKAKNYNI